MGGIDLCEQREAKTEGEGRSISVDREAKTGGGGAIDFCCGGDPSVSKERQIGGGFLFLLVNPWGGMGAGELGDWDREERELGGE